MVTDTPRIVCSLQASLCLSPQRSLEAQLQPRHCRLAVTDTPRQFSGHRAPNNTRSRPPLVGQPFCVCPERPHLAHDKAKSQSPRVHGSARWRITARIDATVAQRTKAVRGAATRAAATRSPSRCVATGTSARVDVTVRTHAWCHCVQSTQGAGRRRAARGARSSVVLRQPRLQLDQHARLLPPGARGAVEQLRLHADKVHCGRRESAPQRTERRRSWRARAPCCSNQGPSLVMRSRSRMTSRSTALSAVLNTSCHSDA